MGEQRRRMIKQFISMKGIVPGLAATLLAIGGAAAQQPVNFSGKSIVMVVGSAPGGGSDAVARLVAEQLSKYLPGKPNIIVQNQPGAAGITSMNLFYQKAKPDGLSINMASVSQGDPVIYRQPQVTYDPTKLEFIGGIGRGGSAIVIRKDAEERLYDKSKPPVIMGGVAGQPRSGTQLTVWGIDILGWNAKWVLGYPGTNDLFVALERGEIDMTATSNLFQLAKLQAEGKFKVLTQTGLLEDGKFLPRSEFADVPVFPNQVEGRINDPIQQQGYQYWISLILLEKFLVLPPNTPKAVIATYREAFSRMAKDPEFQERGRKISQDLDAQNGEDIEKLIKLLDQTSPQALEYINGLMKKQGISQ
jgi:tripartite-type tricarboxylate transporter receptor subunit TctC